MLADIARIASPSALPPAVALPSFGDGFWGWTLAVVALVAPTAVLAFRSHMILGHWSRFFAQWRRRSWQGLLAGQVALAVALVIAVGILPDWSRRWQTWQAATTAQFPDDATALGWIDQMHSRMMALWQFGAITLCLGGVVVMSLCLWQILRGVLVRRQPVAASREWMMAPPVTHSRPRL
jgi:hypothetical protein